MGQDPDISAHLQPLLATPSLVAVPALYNDSDLQMELKDEGNLHQRERFETTDRMYCFRAFSFVSRCNWRYAEIGEYAEYHEI